jgi:hypothetical protein
MSTTAPFQTMEEVDDYLSGSAITCLVCHRRLQRLDRHVQIMHDMSASAYRERFGIPGRRTLTSAASRARSSIVMTPERIEEFRRSVAGKYATDLRGRRFKPWVPALLHRLRKTVEARRTRFRDLVAVSCPACGAAVTTTGLSGPEPILCVDCSTPAALRERQAYLGRIGQASSPTIPIQETNQC